MVSERKPMGAWFQSKGGCEFRVYAPLLGKLAVHLIAPEDRLIPMVPEGNGYWAAQVDKVSANTRYFFRLPGGIDRPDPASHYQPEDVFGPSRIVDQNEFKWSDEAWRGLPLEKMVIYELHVGTFTDEGTFHAVIRKLDYLQELGINAVELMPVAEFPNDRNWGYDGVFPFAVEHSYGGFFGLKELVNSCHKRGMAVILDVVYNHLGPEGNVLPEYMPVFTDKYKTPWGKAINFDDEYSDGIRDFFIQNALFWLEHYHIDALRLDAVHGIYDFGAKHFLRELAEEVDAFSRSQGRKYYLIAESDLNDVRVVKPRARGGHGLDAQWSDDFHHALHTLLTQEDHGYYQDFQGVDALAKVLKEGFVHTGGYSPFRHRHYGNSPEGVSANRFVVCTQNHDQVGNRAQGERLCALAGFEAAKLAAGVLMMSPFVPMVFMGEEYGERAPFLYFMSFHDQALIEAVRQGRQKEFAKFEWRQQPPDPYSIETYMRSKLQWQRGNGHHKMFLFYQKLIALRRKLPVLKRLNKEHLQVHVPPEPKVLLMRRWYKHHSLLILFNFNDRQVSLKAAPWAGPWKKLIDSSDANWSGPGARAPERISHQQPLDLNPFNCVVYEHESL